jgi:uncharacterized membrane protein
MTLSIDLKALINLGPKALIMFLTGTLGIVIGGPIAVLVVGTLNPDLLGASGADEIWRGLATIAGSWIGGGANQAAMFEVFQYNPEKYGGMILVDIVVANIWMAIILLGVGRSDKIDRWLKADNSSIEELKQKVTAHNEKITRPTDSDVFSGLRGGWCCTFFWRRLGRVSRRKFCHHTRQRPGVLLSWIALSMDGGNSHCGRNRAFLYPSQKPGRGRLE